MATAGGMQSDDEEPQSIDEQKKSLVAVNEIKACVLQVAQEIQKSH